MMLNIWRLLQCKMHSHMWIYGGIDRTCWWWWSGSAASPLGQFHIPPGSTCLAVLLRMSHRKSWCDDPEIIILLRFLTDPFYIFFDPNWYAELKKRSTNLRFSLILPEESLSKGAMQCKWMGQFNKVLQVWLDIRDAAWPRRSTCKWIVDNVQL